MERRKSSVVESREELLTWRLRGNSQTPEAGRSSRQKPQESESESDAGDAGDGIMRDNTLTHEKLQQLQEVGLYRLYEALTAIFSVCLFNYYRVSRCVLSYIVA